MPHNRSVPFAVDTDDMTEALWKTEYDTQFATLARSKRPSAPVPFIPPEAAEDDEKRGEDQGEGFDFRDAQQQLVPPPPPLDGHIRKPQSSRVHYETPTDVFVPIETESIHSDETPPFTSATALASPAPPLEPTLSFVSKTRGSSSVDYSDFEKSKEKVKLHEEYNLYRQYRHGSPPYPSSPPPSSVAPDEASTVAASLTQRQPKSNRYRDVGDSGRIQSHSEETPPSRSQRPSHESRGRDMERPVSALTEDNGAGLDVAELGENSEVPTRTRPMSSLREVPAHNSDNGGVDISTSAAAAPTPVVRDSLHSTASSSYLWPNPLYRATAFKPTALFDPILGGTDMGSKIQAIASKKGHTGFVPETETMGRFKWAQSLSDQAQQVRQSRGQEDLSAATHVFGRPTQRGAPLWIHGSDRPKELDASSIRQSVGGAARSTDGPIVGKPKARSVTTDPHNTHAYLTPAVGLDSSRSREGAQLSRSRYGTGGAVEAGEGAAVGGVKDDDGRGDYVDSLRSTGASVMTADSLTNRNQQPVRSDKSNSSSERGGGESGVSGHAVRPASASSRHSVQSAGGSGAAHPPHCSCTSCMPRMPYSHRNVQTITEAQSAPSGRFRR